MQHKTKQMGNIIRCKRTHLDALAGLFGRAFFNDPLYKYVFPDATQRVRLTAWDLGKIVEYGLHFGEVYATSMLSGCVVWLPPGETDFTEERMAEVGMLDSAAHIGAEPQARMMRFVMESEEFHRRVAPSHHWYMVLLGVDPSRQGQGIGSELIAPVLEKADRGMFPVYLETASPDNLAFYHRFGFEVCAEAALTDGGAYIWYMVRKPV